VFISIVSIKNSARNIYRSFSSLDWPSFFEIPLHVHLRDLHMDCVSLEPISRRVFNSFDLIELRFIQWVDDSDRRFSVLPLGYSGAWILFDPKDPSLIDSRYSLRRGMYTTLSFTIRNIFIIKCFLTDNQEKLSSAASINHSFVNNVRRRTGRFYVYDLLCIDKKGISSVSCFSLVLCYSHFIMFND
jgi:hypothetical protein